MVKDVLVYFSIFQTAYKIYDINRCGEELGFPTCELDVLMYTTFRKCLKTLGLHTPFI